MTKKNELYKCEVCENIVSVMHVGAGVLMCCGQEMKLLEAGVEDAAVEKHIPFVSRNDDGIRVQIGEVLHPMDEEHYIEWITIVANNKTKTVFLAPSDAPEAQFTTTAERITVYAYCNLHGLWKVEA